MGYACKKGLKPESPNQDDFFIAAVDRVCGLYGVFDGHGPYGHDISGFVHQHLPEKILKSENLAAHPMETLKKAFLETHKKCAKAGDKGRFDATLSGTTATVVMVKEEEQVLYVAHVGDSRAVAAKQVQRDDEILLEVEDLTVDHKPSNPEEKVSIEQLFYCMIVF